MIRNKLEDFDIYEKFFADSKYEKNKRCVKEKGNVFIYNKGSKKYGRRLSYDEFNSVFTIKDVDYEKQWKNQINRAIKCLEKSGLWTEIYETYKNLQNVEKEELQDICNLYKHRDKYLPYSDNKLNEYYKKYNFLFKQDENNILSLNERYFGPVANCELKSMYFGRSNKFYKDMISSSLEEKKNYSIWERVNYDVSFRYDAEENKAWYSEEYKDCGNGHYYLALDNSTALFIEND